jgi:hypothetical protein
MNRAAHKKSDNNLLLIMDKKICTYGIDGTNYTVRDGNKVLNKVIE